MAGVLDELVLRVVAHEGVHPGPGPGPDGRVFQREPILERVRTGTRVALGQRQVLGRSLERRPAVEIGDLDDERVALPATARVAEIGGDVRADVGRSVSRDDPGLVHHLSLHGHEVGRLRDLQTVVVDGGHRHQPAGDAAHPVTEVFRALCRPTAPEPAARRRRARLRLGGPFRNPAVRRVDDHRDLTGRRRLDVAECRVTPLRFVAPYAGKGAPLPARRRLFGCQDFRTVLRVARSLERNAMRGVAGPHALQVRRAPGCARHGVVPAFRGDVGERRRLGDHPGESRLDHGETHVVRTGDDRASGRCPPALRYGRVLDERDPVAAQLRRRRVEVLHGERDVVDGATRRGRGRPAFVLHGQQPDIVQQNAVEPVTQPGGLAPEGVLVPTQGPGRVGRAQVDVMETQVVAVLDQFDARPPGVEDEPVLEQPRHVAQRRPVLEPLQSYAAAGHADRLELVHLRGQIGVRERNVIDAGAFAAAEGRPRLEHDLHARAVDAVVTVGQRLAFEMPRVPPDRLGGVRHREMHVMIVGRGHAGGRRRHRRRRQRQRGYESSSSHAGYLHLPAE